jgi:hypothetical protein
MEHFADGLTVFRCLLLDFEWECGLLLLLLLLLRLRVLASLVPDMILQRKVKKKFAKKSIQTERHHCDDVICAVAPAVSLVRDAYAWFARTPVPFDFGASVCYLWQGRYSRGPAEHLTGHILLLF